MRSSAACDDTPDLSRKSYGAQSVRRTWSAGPGSDLVPGMSKVAVFTTPAVASHEVATHLCAVVGIVGDWLVPAPLTHVIL